MTQWVKVLVTKPDVLSLIPLGPTKWKKKLTPPVCTLTAPWVLWQVRIDPYTYTHIKLINVFLKLKIITIKGDIL